MNSIALISGWMLSRIVALDEHLPGLAGQYLRASSERRHVIAAYCSVRPYVEDRAADEAMFLATATHRAILQSAFDTVPQGFRAALGRMEPSRQDVLVYPLLHNLLAQPPHARTARTLYALPVIDHVKLKIVQRLPKDLCDPAIVMALDNERKARALVRIVPRMIEAGADARGLINALRVAGDDRLGETVLRWCLRIHFPVGPVAPSTLFTPITNGRQLRTMALRYRNCLRTFIGQILEGKVAFGEYRHADEAVMVQFNNDGGVWYQEAAYAYRNRLVDDHVRRAAEDYCRQRGVHPRRSLAREERSDWALLSDVGGVRNFLRW